MMVASVYPPSFDDNPLSYGFALFSLTLVSSISLAQLMAYWLEGRRISQISRRWPTFSMPHERQWTLLSVHRSILAGLHMTILFGALPDVLVMLAWGEASTETMNRLAMIDRVFDAATLWPYLASTALSAWVAQSLPQRLVIDSPVQLAVPQWWMVKDKLRIVVLVLTIAAGVTLGKAGL